MTNMICIGCGSELINCGPPIWEDYCSNKQCTYLQDKFKKQLKESGKKMRAEKFMKDAAPELYEMLRQTEERFDINKGIDEEEYIYRQEVRAALAKARGEQVMVTTKERISVALRELNSALAQGGREGLKIDIGYNYLDYVVYSEGVKTIVTVTAKIVNEEKL